MNAIWITSMILQWMVILALCVIVLSLMRQLGERVPRQPAEQDPEKIFPPFAEIPEQSIPLLSGEMFSFGGTSAEPTLIVFFSPKCGACEQLPEALLELTKQRPTPDFKLLAVLKRSTREESLAFVREKGLQRLAVANEEDFPAELNPGGAPFAAAIAGGGTVAARGRPKVFQHLREMAHAAANMAHMVPDHSRRKHEWGESAPYWEPERFGARMPANPNELPAEMPA